MTARCWICNAIIENGVACDECKEPRGLKDNEIAELVNAIRDAVAPITKHQCLRELVSKATVNYLKSEGLKIDE